MSLEEIRGRLAGEAGFAEPKAPVKCRGCRNLLVNETRMGRKILSCALESAYSQTFPRDMVRGERILDGATAEWAAQALLEDIPTEPGSSKFHDRADMANPQCPVIDKVINQLVSASPDQVIDITPPQPLVPGGEVFDIVLRS
jgi:hypothetical protein